MYFNKHRTNQQSIEQMLQQASNKDAKALADYQWRLLAEFRIFSCRLELYHSRFLERGMCWFWNNKNFPTCNNFFFRV